MTQGTTTELNLQDFSTEAALNITAVTFEDSEAALEAYSNGQCDAVHHGPLRSLLAAYHLPQSGRTT